MKCKVCVFVPKSTPYFSAPFTLLFNTTIFWEILIIYMDVVKTINCLHYFHSTAGDCCTTVPNTIDHKHQYNYVTSAFGILAIGACLQMVLKALATL